MAHRPSRVGVRRGGGRQRPHSRLRGRRDGRRRSGRRGDDRQGREPGHYGRAGERHEPLDDPVAAHAVRHRLLLSCEGGETYNANPAALESYLNAGGRAFGSHYHYAWFSGPIGSFQAYTAPADWGNNLAAWTAGGGNSSNQIGGIIDTTLNNGGGTFVKGQALQQWLGIVNALGQNMVPATELSIYQPRYNAVVSAADKPSQPWITSDGAMGSMAGETMYFSFDTPVNAMPAADGGAPNYCGRAVFSDLHVAGATR